MPGQNILGSCLGPLESPIGPSTITIAVSSSASQTTCQITNNCTASPTACYESTCSENGSGTLILNRISVSEWIAHGFTGDNQFVATVGGCCDSEIVFVFGSISPFGSVTSSGHFSGCPLCNPSPCNSTQDPWFYGTGGTTVIVLSLSGEMIMGSYQFDMDFEIQAPLIDCCSVCGYGVSTFNINQSGLSASTITSGSVSSVVSFPDVSCANSGSLPCTHSNSAIDRSGSASVTVTFS